ncbi:hypothetical protein NDU88_001585 [Pleurodeles waltl]|uniref:Uncharacterized protein n=1 Tax=Pleurodeles waltl TaxID=8319 RepID=A0AAV7U795_PLEWA|nr:hypothetical protein NDU88_001585 [Pleurodeles waltl]
MLGRVRRLLGCWPGWGPWSGCTSRNSNRKTAGSLVAADGYGQLRMASQKHSKKEASLKDLFTKTPAKKTVQSGAPDVQS